MHVSNLKCKVLISGYYEDKLGQFIVKEYCYSYTSILKSIEQIKSESQLDSFSKGPYIAFISGLKLGVDMNFKNDSLDSSYRLTLTYLIRLFGNQLEKFALLSNIIQNTNRLIICGGIGQINTRVEEVDDGSYVKASFNEEVINSTMKNWDLIDEFLSKLVKVVNVDLMPGEDELTNSIFPQVQFSRFLFPRSHKFSTLNLVQNPYKFDLDNTTFYGTSGQNITSYKKFTNIEDEIIILEKILELGHYSPCYPDMLR